jgi:hypothetical protein
MISFQLKDFSSFIETLGEVAEDGLLDKAAEGITAIAEAINKIDIDKTVAFSDLFQSAEALGSNRSAYRQLTKAVQDLTDIFASAGGGEAEGEGGGGLGDRIKW